MCFRSLEEDNTEFTRGEFTSVVVVNRFYLERLAVPVRYLLGFLL